MHTGTHRLTSTLVALAFVAGWFSASWVSPPTAVTQMRPSRPVAPLPEVAIPRVALDAVSAAVTTPADGRNPFLFAGRGETRAALAGTPAAGDDAGAAARLDGDPAVDAAPVVPEGPAWRVIGIASDTDGAHTAIVSGGSEVLLLTVGARMPDGSEVVAIDPTRVVLRLAAGESLTLRLP